MAPEAPPKKARITSTAGGSWPVAAARASRAAKVISASVVAMSHRRRSSRSASAPPSGANRPIGMNVAAATSPVHAGCPVRANTSTPSATVCIHVPTLETSAADQMRAKFRERSGRSDARATERGYRPPTWPRRAEPPQNRARRIRTEATFGTARCSR